MKIGRITCSDRASAGIYADISGPEIEAVCREVWSEPLEFMPYIIPDEQDRIEVLLKKLVDLEKCPLILTTGGTGISRRDVTPEATLSVIEKELPGFGEMMRAHSFKTVPTAILSRATAGVRGQSLIINLPGNPKAIRECLPPLAAAIHEALLHLAD
jgi:molybdopterin adenylyltransferase